MTPAEFRAAREYLCLSQADLAETWGVDPRTIRKWESGDRPMNPIAAYAIKLMMERDDVEE